MMVNLGKVLASARNDHIAWTKQDKMPDGTPLLAA
jgi:hypothetical protein